MNQLLFANSQYFGVILTGGVYQTGGAYQRGLSNTILTAQRGIYQIRGIYLKVGLYQVIYYKPLKQARVGYICRKKGAKLFFLLKVFVSLRLQPVSPVRYLVSSSDWLTQQLYDKGQNATKVNVNRVVNVRISYKRFNLQYILLQKKQARRNSCTRELGFCRITFVFRAYYRESLIHKSNMKAQSSL